MSDAVAGPSPPPAHGRQPEVTYARARLWLGIGCVGTFVVAAVVALTVDAPGALLPDATSWAWTDAPLVVLLIGLYALVSAPFDVAGA